MKNKLSDNMKSLDNAIWNCLGLGHSTRTVNHTIVKNSDDTPMAFKLQFHTNSSAKYFDDTFNKIRKAASIDLDIVDTNNNNNIFYIVPIVTDDEKYNLLELKAYIIGQEVLEAQKKVLESKQKWLQPLKELAAAKKQREVA